MDEIPPGTLDASSSGASSIDEVVALRLEDGRAYVHQDANYNVIGLTDLTGRVLERYSYSPYGELEVAFDAHFFDDDGDVDATDLAAATSGGDCWGDYSGDCRRLDADADRDIDAADYTAISAFIDGLSGDQAIQRTPAPTHSQLGNAFAHQGLVFDAEIGSYQNRARQYNPRLKRFMQRDPAGYANSLSRYQYALTSPCRVVDPDGRKIIYLGGNQAWGYPTSGLGQLADIAIGIASEAERRYPLQESLREIPGPADLLGNNTWQVAELRHEVSSFQREWCGPRLILMGFSDGATTLYEYLRLYNHQRIDFVGFVDMVRKDCCWCLGATTPNCCPNEDPNAVVDVDFTAVDRAVNFRETSGNFGYLTYNFVGYSINPDVIAITEWTFPNLAHDTIMNDAFVQSEMANEALQAYVSP